MTPWLAIIALFPAAGPQAARRPFVRHPIETPSVITTKTTAASHGNVIGGGSFSLTISPSTISFAATNPDSTPVVAGSSAATVSWFYIDLATGDWNLAVQAASPVFTNCPSIPVSAVTVSCASIQKLVGGVGNCSAPFQLSTTPHTLASGTQQILTFDYVITINYTLNDSWRYIAQTNPSCSLSLNYTANVP